MQTTVDPTNIPSLYEALKNRDLRITQQAKELEELREDYYALQMKVNKDQHQRERIFAASLAGIEHSRHFREA